VRQWTIVLDGFCLRSTWLIGRTVSLRTGATSNLKLGAGDEPNPNLPVKNRWRRQTKNTDGRTSAQLLQPAQSSGSLYLYSALNKYKYHIYLWHVPVRTTRSIGRVEKIFSERACTTIHLGKNICGYVTLPPVDTGASKNIGFLSATK
jgi:hypothetical protein